MQNMEQYKPDWVLTWLEYKRIKHIVRYSPTLGLYSSYKLYALANGFIPEGNECPEDEAAAALRARLQKRLDKRRGG